MTFVTTNTFQWVALVISLNGDFTSYIIQLIIGCEVRDFRFFRFTLVKTYWLEVFFKTFKSTYRWNKENFKCVQLVSVSLTD